MLPVGEYSPQLIILKLFLSRNLVIKSESEKQVEPNCPLYQFYHLI